MVEKTRVSVAMVTYNGEKYVKEQLDSILLQLNEQDEIVVSDDGSKDGTQAILREYQQRDSRIRLTKGPGMGVKKNVEHALRQCQGKIIFLADQDDIWKEDKVQKVLEVMEREQCTLVIHDAAVFHKDPKVVMMESFFAFRSAGAGVIKNIVKNSYIGCCMAFQKEILERALPIPDSIEMHDQWIGILNDFYYKKSVFFRETLLFYRRHGENTSGMEHYGILRMIRNRIVFCLHFIGRFLHIC